MKKFFSILCLAAAGLWLGSCEQDHIEVVYHPSDVVGPTVGTLSGPNGGVLTADGEPVVLTYTKADYGVPTNVSYSLYVGLVESAATALRVADLSKMTRLATAVVSADPATISVAQKDLNAALIVLEATPDEACPVQFVLVTNLANDKGTPVEGTEFCSEAIAAEFTPYSAVLYPETIGVTGSFQGWAPAAAPRLWGNAEKGTYWGYVSMFADDDVEYKFTVQTNWDGPNYGDGGSGAISDSGGNLKIGSGLYRFDVDLVAMTAKTTPLTKVGLIGDGVGGWDTDHYELVRDPEDGLYKVSGATTTGGEFKVRFNGDWADNLGGDPNDLTLNGSNIEIGAGTYDFVLDLSHTPYKITFTVSE